MPFQKQMVDLDSLNPSQLEAVTHGEGAMMVLAGAGSGKTRVLTFRIAYLIENGLDPFNILALTFTNKAAREMKSRIINSTGQDARNLWMGTFHSVFSRILRAEGEKIGFPKNFTIYDTDDSKSLIKSVVKGLNLDDKLYKPSVVLNRISSAKNNLISPDQYLDDGALVSEDYEAQRPELGRIYKEYFDRCFRAQAMDFDDLLYYTHILFNNHPDVLNQYQARFQYVLVDEFQDTNYSQYLLTKKLAARFQNICVVGDDAQSIYAFRGADIGNILNFEKDYPEMKIFKLEQNYRSTKTLVEAANQVIAQNKAQLPKTVWTENEGGDRIELIRAGSDSEEGRLVASAIFQQKMNLQLKNEDFAILYRTNAQSRALEEALRKANIPYRIYGGLSFYQRKEIKDAIAYMRFTINPNDEEALKRIINFPKRGIGPTTVAKILVLAKEKNCSLWEIIQKADSLFPPRAAKGLLEFASLLNLFAMDAREKNAYAAAETIIKNSGLLREYYEDKSIEGMARYENLQELLSGIREFSDNETIEDHSLAAFLQDIALLTDQDLDSEQDLDRVTMMTIHSAKGLEFNHVILAGMEEDLFPSQMMMSSRADLEEERRLFYVAITRAEKKLILSHASTRYRYGMLHTCEPSRFLKEIPETFISQTYRAGGFGKTPKPARSFNKSPELKRTPAANLKPLRKLKSTYTPSPDFKPDDLSNLQEGMRVEHPKFGFGVIEKLENYNSQRKASVKFDDFGEKTLLLSFAKLKIHSK